MVPPGEVSQITGNRAKDRQREKPGPGDVILALLQTGPEVTVPGFAITGANYILLVLELLWTGLSFLQCRIQTNAECPQCRWPVP